eukprot:TRINITY_DN121_c0_g1_i10.p4 TRINITY_DN121_c0_g1~~TRINITY_DN121_c0_g1_i10.p4  ORF type:complete len:161 (-),score=8.53 TRINITY_DN121_c0_g1_i10:1034-1516(-)
MISKITMFLIFMCFVGTFSEMDGKLSEVIYETSISDYQYNLPEMENSLGNEYSQDLEEYEGNGQQQMSKENLISTSLPTVQVNTVQEDPTLIGLAPIFVPVPSDSIAGSLVPTVTSLFPTLPYALKPMEVGLFEGGFEIQGVFEKLLPVQASSDYFFEEY